MRNLIVITLCMVLTHTWAQQTPQKPTAPAQTTTTSSAVGCDWGDCQNGYGKYTFNNGDYIGFWKNGLKHGYGSYYWTETKGQYIGRWQDDTMNGYGVYIGENGDNLRGQYKDGKMNGIGVTVRDDKWDQGIFANGDLSNRYSYASNNKSSGCTIGDCQNGYGRWEYDNGDFYIGFFNNGNLKQGTYTFENGAKYSGEFNSANQMHGMGRYWATDQSYYGGEWANGKFHGLGYYDNKASGKKEIGIWSNSTLTKSMY